MDRKKAISIDLRPLIEETAKTLIFLCQNDLKHHGFIKKDKPEMFEKQGLKFPEPLKQFLQN